MPTLAPSARRPRSQAVPVWLVDPGPRPAKALALLRRAPLDPAPERPRLHGRPAPLPLLLGTAGSAAAADALVEAAAAIGCRLETETFLRASGTPLEDVDLDGLWAGPADPYTEPPPSDQLIASVEHELGHRLPDAYIALARSHNGGLLRRDRFPAPPNGWADDHVAVTGIAAIGRTSTWALCGALGSPFMQQEWGFPPTGVVFATTPTGGHQALMLDHRACGPRGEPAVVHVDADEPDRPLPLATDFASFLRGLRAAPLEEEDGDLDGFEMR